MRSSRLTDDIQTSGRCRVYFLALSTKYVTTSRMDGRLPRMTIGHWALGTLEVPPAGEACMACKILLLVSH